MNNHQCLDGGMRWKIVGRKKTRDPVPALQCPRNQLLKQRRLDGITVDRRTYLHVFKRGTVTDVRYRDEVSEPYVCLFKDAVDLDFILMDDNRRSHTAHLVAEQGK
ncbi:DDE_3 domain-containing protein [Trichonephila clavipes]|nr:DDE_3 domain-containing protein [Trichonephila clavipes]